jgi:hypothetical protein
LHGQPQSQLHGPNVAPLIHHFSTVVSLLERAARRVIDSFTIPAEDDGGRSAVSLPRWSVR